ncbi:MAG: class C sortase [Ruminococcus sp.]
MKKKRNVISTAILVVLLLVGLSVMLYPTVSDWWNSRVQTRAIATYNQSVEQMDTGDKERLLMEAHSYNATLSHLTAPFTNWEDAGNYDKILDISGTGIMGYISIPKIQVELPIYHGTSAEVLNVAVGHLQGSSFPVGGENTHAVISAHRGLPSAKLFSDLDQLVEGDTFTVTILDEVLTYEVEKIFIVKPDELDKLAIIPGGDYVTLMTCTTTGSTPTGFWCGRTGWTPSTPTTSRWQPMPSSWILCPWCRLSLHRCSWDCWCSGS